MSPSGQTAACQPNLAMSALPPVPEAIGEHQPSNPAVKAATFSRTPFQIVLLNSVLSIMAMPEAGRQVIYRLVIILMLLVYGRGERVTS
jgi:hypothetical protein